jgi:hypothetical protein
MNDSVTLCSFCNKPATTYHIPPNVNSKTFAAIPLCGGDHRGGVRTKKKSKKCAT